ncbi:tryptophan 7-halogenase [Sphingomonas sabuli]|uniref:Tryptophan 7-halogenase n=1 Tax=Sphingomonas sabuli TaxID=2764186 RepID=A0A7G9KZQ8_9SPHN|nr:tryptophan 7-halogenase [Sphingomonas sabuli]QNM81857.1 tryptophan 7-halogenase [Sphingomonas sabuli]
MMSAGKQQLVIVGDGFAGSTAAAMLSCALPADRFAVSICAASGDDPDDLAAVQPLSPGIGRLCARTGIAENDLINLAGGSFALGTAFSNWGARGEGFLPFGDIGVPLFGLPFGPVALHARQSPDQFLLSDFSVATLLARSGRFQRPSPDPRSPMSSFDYGMHVLRKPYLAQLRSVARRGGVQSLGVVRDATITDGRVAEFVLDDGERVATDFVIDASGPQRRIASRLGATFCSWSESFGYDRVGAQSFATDVPPSPFAMMTAHACGWRLSCPAQGMVSEVVSFDSARASDSDIAGKLVANSYGEPREAMHFAACAPGRLDRAWSGNCVAIGSASAVTEPGSAEAADLLVSALENFLTLYSGSPDAVTEAGEYNRLSANALDCARDFAAARYILGARPGDPFWADRAKADPSPSLAAKIAAFRARGRVPLVDGDRADEEEWATLLDMLGVVPAQVGLMTSSVPAEDARRQLARLREAMIRAVVSAPRHGDYLASLGREAAA